MNLSYRNFLLQKDGTVVRIANPRFFEVYCGRQPLEEFAGQRVRWLSVHVELRDKKPCRITGYHASVLWLDARGFVRDDKQNEYERLKMELGSLSQGSADKATKAEGRAKFERLRREWEWEPTAKEMAAVEKLIWPKGKP